MGAGGSGVERLSSTPLQIRDQLGLYKIGFQKTRYTYSTSITHTGKLRPSEQGRDTQSHPSSNGARILAWKFSILHQVLGKFFGSPRRQADLGMIDRFKVEREAVFKVTGNGPVVEGGVDTSLCPHVSPRQEAQAKALCLQFPSF